MSQFKPMLSAKLVTPVFPYLASPKLDGIRCVIIGGVALSRTLKPIPNKHIQKILGNTWLNGLDGEIICGDPTDEACFRNTTTVVMSHDKVENFTFNVFDDFGNPASPFHTRLGYATARVADLKDRFPLIIVPHFRIDNEADFELTEKEFIGDGYEGMMVRSIGGKYKFGRTTAKENILSKVKRFSDSEAIVIGVEELLHNHNEKVTDNLGNSKRSSHKENKQASGTMGALVVRDVKSGVEFNIGTGFDAVQREQLWVNRDKIIGQTLTYKSFHIGVKDKPRHPVFKFWRTPGF